MDAELLELIENAQTGKEVVELATRKFVGEFQEDESVEYVKYDFKTNKKQIIKDEIGKLDNTFKEQKFVDIRRKTVGKDKLDYYSTTDYYKDEKNNLQFTSWHGKLAKSIGLQGSVKDEDKRFLARGFNPKTGEALCKGAGEKHVMGWDVTCSAPKTVSLAFAFSDSKTKQLILTAHQNATKKAMDYLESNAITRVGTNGVDRQKVKSLAISTYSHMSSREQDPQLHNHSIIYNVCERQDGSFGTIDSITFFNDKMVAGALYRSDLANSLKAIGFDAVFDGKDNFFLKGFEEEELVHFSKRRQQILADLKDNGMTSAKASEIAALKTRKGKDEPPYEELMDLWAQSGAHYGLNENRIETIRTFEQRECDEKLVILREDLINELTQSNSTFQERDIFKIILQRTVGKMSPDNAMLFGKQILNDKTIVKELRKDKDGNLKYTTHEMFNIEKSVVEFAYFNKDKRNQTVSQTSIDNAVKTVEIEMQKRNPLAKLNKEQVEAIQKITKDSGDMWNVEGWSGAGKTTMLQAVRIAYENETKVTGRKYQLIGCALAGKAAQGLEKEAGIPSQTLDSLLMELDSGKKKLTADTVIVMDEAGMVSSKHYGRLVTHMEKARNEDGNGPKLISVGDSKQLQPIEAGQLFKAINEFIGHSELSSINRQRFADGDKKGEVNEVEVSFVKDLANGKAEEAVNYLKQNDRYHVDEGTDKLITKIAKDYLNDENDFKSKLILAGTNLELLKINETIREELKATGYLQGKAVYIGDKEFMLNDRIVCMTNDKRNGIFNGTTGTIEDMFVDKHGDYTIRIKKDEDNKYVNINLSKYSDIESSYAISTHKSQGQTVNNTYVLCSENMTDKEWGYVAGSRHRNQCDLYATNYVDEILLERLAQSRGKDTTIDHALKEEFDNHIQSKVGEYQAKAEADKKANQLNVKQFRAERVRKETEKTNMEAKLRKGNGKNLPKDLTFTEMQELLGKKNAKKAIEEQKLQNKGKGLSL